MNDMTCFIMTFFLKCPLSPIPPHSTSLLDLTNAQIPKNLAEKWRLLLQQRQTKAHTDLMVRCPKTFGHIVCIAHLSISQNFLSVEQA